MASSGQKHDEMFAKFLVEESEKQVSDAQKIRESFDRKARKAIKADGVRVIAACHDLQKALGIGEDKHGVFTKSILKVLKENKKSPGTPLTWVNLYKETQHNMEEEKSVQKPQLTSSRDILLEEEMHIVPPESAGKRTALLIGINYKGQAENELTGCHDDTMSMKDYLIQHEGFKEEEIIILMDDRKHTEPTKENIMAELEKVALSEPGDSYFLYFSGHGGSVADRNGDDADGLDETLVPSDAQKLYNDTRGWKARKERAAYIIDDNILKVMVRPLKPGVTLTCLIDCCHSGTVFDLPYRYNGTGVTMERDYGIKFHHLAYGFGVGCVGAVVGVTTWQIVNLLE